MKLEELYEGLLEEGLSPVLYHATNISTAVKMLRSDSIRSAAGQISFTRSLTGSYHIDNRMIGVIFELDGRKINQRYYGNPIGTEDFDDDTVFRGKENRQLEDRLQTSELKNLTSYINGIHLYTPKDVLDDIDELSGRQSRQDELENEYIPNLQELRVFLNQIRTFYKGNIIIHTRRTPTRGGDSKMTVQNLLKQVYKILQNQGARLI